MQLAFTKKIHLLRVGVFAGLLASLAGCGPSAGTVTGTVTYKGKALTFGNVQVRSHAGSVFAGTIGSDGTYSVPGVPAGPAQVSVSAIDPRFEDKMRELVGANKMPGTGDTNMGRVASGGGGGAVDRTQYSAIPLTYEAFETSMLTVEVKRGVTKKDIPLD